MFVVDTECIVISYVGMHGRHSNCIYNLQETVRGPVNDLTNSKGINAFPQASLQGGGVLPNECIENAAAKDQLDRRQVIARSIHIVIQLEVVPTHVDEAEMLEPTGCLGKYVDFQT